MLKLCSKLSGMRQINKYSWRSHSSFAYNVILYFHIISCRSFSDFHRFAILLRILACHEAEASMIACRLCLCARKVENFSVIHFYYALKKRKRLKRLLYRMTPSGCNFREMFTRTRSMKYISQDRAYRSGYFGRYPQYSNLSNLSSINKLDATCFKNTDVDLKFIKLLEKNPWEKIT